MKTTKTIVRAHAIAPHTYTIVAEINGRTCETLCTLSTAQTSSGKTISKMNFASPEFNTLLMRGEIDFQEVRAAIRKAKDEAGA